MPEENSELKDFRALSQAWQRATTLNDPPRAEDCLRGHPVDPEQDCALFAVRSGEIELLRAGDAFCALAHLTPAPDWTKASLNLASALHEGVTRSARTCKPAIETIRNVEAGIVRYSEILFLPIQADDESTILAIARARPASWNILESVYRATSDGVLIVTPVRRDGSLDYQIVDLNAAAATFLAVAQKDAAWRMLSDLLGVAQKENLFRRLMSIRDGQATRDFELDRDERREEQADLCVSAVRVGDLITLTLSDITFLREREETMRRVLDDNPVPHWIYDPETLRLRYVNEAALARYEYDRETMLGLSLLNLHPPEDADCVKLEARKRFSRFGERSDWTHVSSSGRRLDVLVYKRDILFDRKRCILAIMVDMTDQREAERRVQHFAHHDPLTGLPNRALFRERLNQALCAPDGVQEPIAVHCLDLDRFKAVNEMLGHAAGDDLLRQVAERIDRHVRDQGLLTRLGSDEFAIIQTHGDAAQLADALVVDLSESFIVHGQDVQIGSSIGVAHAAPDDDADTLLRKANVALCRAKNDGRQTHRVFEPSLDAHFQTRRDLEKDLRRTIRSNQLSLAYQPLVLTSTGEVVGCEALLRWRHPVKGDISPAEFIPLAEETGQIAAIGEWVLREACAEATHWPDHVKVAVNLSPVQFRSPGIVQTVRDALIETGLPPHRLELEITENVILATSTTNVDLLHQFRDLGVSIALDDFGTGYSSLSYLQAFRVDKIKVDRSFIANLPQGADSQMIVRAIGALGRSLGMRTLAEGVETPEQLECLRAEGYDEMQGYLFSPPRTAEDVRALLTRRLAA